MQRGLSVVIWRVRHVSEPTQLAGPEAARYFADLLVVGRAIETTLAPIKINYDLLGNTVPHLHTRVVPRYADDPLPGWPFPFPNPEPAPLSPADVRADVEALRAACRVQ